jgi:hypothetical protein
MISTITTSDHAKVRVVKYGLILIFLNLAFIVSPMIYETQVYHRHSYLLFTLYKTCFLYSVKQLILKSIALFATII